MFPSRPRSRLYSDKDDGVAALVRRGRWEKVVPYEAESSTKRRGEQGWLKKTFSNLQLSPGAWRVKSGMKRWEPGWEEMRSQEERKVPWGLSATGARSRFTQHLPAVSSLHIPLASELVQTQARRRWGQESNLQPSRNDCCVPYNHNMPFENYHFIYFWLLWVFVAVQGLSLVTMSRGYSIAAVRRLLITLASLVAELGDRTCLSCISRQILTHCTTREVPSRPLQMIWMRVIFYKIGLWPSFGNEGYHGG